VHTLPDGPPRGYPDAMVDHRQERSVALQRFEAIKDL